MHQGETSMLEGSLSGSWQKYITRDKETDFFFRAIRGKDKLLQSIEVFGTRSSGVTDFLRHLHDVNSAGKPAARGLQDIIMVYVDIESVENQSDFYEAIIAATRDELAKALKEPIHQSLHSGLSWVTDDAVLSELSACLLERLTPARVPEPVTRRRFDEWLKNLLKTLGGVNFAFLIDSFDHITLHSDEFNLDFLNAMRNWGREGRPSWVIGTHQPVIDICDKIRKPKERISPLSNIFFAEPIILGSIARKEAERLISAWASARGVTLEPDEVDGIIEISGPWPRILNYAAQHWTSLKRMGGSVRKEAVVHMLLSPRLHIANHLAAFWSDLSAEQIRQLRAIVDGSQTVPGGNTNQLELLGVIRQAGQRKRISSLLFEEWIRTCSPAEETATSNWHKTRIESLVRSLNEAYKDYYDIRTQIFLYSYLNGEPLDAENIEGLLDGTRGHLRRELESSGVQDLDLILSRLEQMEDRLYGKLDSFEVIYRQVSSQNQSALAELLIEVHQNKVEQELARRTVAEVQKAIEQIRSQGLPTTDPAIRKALESLADKGSSLDFNQQFELSLPVIPFLLEYKVSLGGGVELGAVWDELCQRIQKRRKKDSPR